MFIGIRIATRLRIGFGVVVLALLAIWGLAAAELHGAADVAQQALRREASAETLAAALARLQNAQVTLALAGVVALVVAAVVSSLLARSITLPLSNAVDSIEAVARGDLTQPLARHSSDEIGRLLGALASMRESLRALVGEVMSGAESVADTSEQIAEGNADLSQRTEEQATTLVETAGSMEELATTVSRNAAHARQASQLASGASDVAVRGGEAVGRVVTTMGDISAASRRIAEITGVIDGIAFQTNLLALNAAVEAARAGDQGRGFAVVAAEVRTLARRSAAAAQEIRQLIADSVEKVDAGTRQVDAAGHTMEEIVAAVRHVTRLMGEIAAAGEAQSSGITQVHGAIAQMDHVVQQNASLVEEAAAATEAMKAQARSLLAMVSRFRLATPARLEWESV